uniref:lymphocyte-specific protein 1 isoform X2 n=1 Tax=Jaculus jaculus TaxID=51337 RepID=UPI001E1B4213|nr:lymphocyte-specific protein 1 isoform X2 [Jaculus jaculus]
MSGPALLRRNSSKLGLEKLLRLTTQWRVEDSEEAAREQRRQERERQLRDQVQDQDEGGHSPELLGQEARLSLKPSEAPELDEDEGFGDWSQKPEQQQRGMAEGTTGGSDLPHSNSAEGDQAENRPFQNVYENQAHENSLHQTGVHLEGLCLSQGKPGPEDANEGPEEAEEEYQTSQHARAPSPVALEGTADLSSPPLSPTTKLADRTESLNRSIKKSNSVKKSQPALPISTIDERLQQYTQATESAGRTPKLSRQASIELPSMAVASTKSLWETGEVQTQSAAKTPSCKDIVAGDMSKKSLWEQRGDAKASPTIKSTPSGKKFKYVATGHGKYEKVLVDEGSTP